MVYLDPVSGGASEEHVAGQPGRLPADVPQRVVDGRHGGQTERPRRKTELLKELQHDELDSPRVFALDHLEDVVGDRLDRQIRAVAVGLAPAVEALIRFDLDERPMPVSVAGHKGLDGGDFHSGLLK